jgi:hypothetical protein
MMRLSKTVFDYVPFPIGVLSDAIPTEKYIQLVDSFPKKELFKYIESLGNKYSLSEVNEPERYRNFINSTPVWKDFYDYVKSVDFIKSVILTLKENNLKLGLENYPIKQKTDGVVSKVISKIGDELSKKPHLSSRFEFSMLSGNGGYLLPHTDNPSKIITLVLTICKEGEWNASYGGGTDINNPIDEKKYFNYLNEQLKFEEVSTLKTVEFEPNQCMIFIKTFNSLHSVSPIKAPNNSLRRSVTINIEMNNHLGGVI